MPKRVVFDTNILFSGIGWHGSPYRCLELAKSGEFQHLSCQGILEELAEKLQNKLHFSDDQITKTILELLEFTDVIKITNSLNVVIDDPDDNMVIECAMVGKADLIVSGDRHLLAMKQYQNIHILRASELLSLMA
jgi:putative PIN family toxin of toxin-antitoxin system